MCRNWRKLSVLVLVLTLLVLGTALPGVTKNNFKWVTKDRIGNPDADIVLTWRAQTGYSLQSPLPARVDYLFKAAEEWARRHPNVRIDLQTFSGSTDVAMSKLLLQAKEERAPDIAQIDSFYVPRFYDYLQPLDRYFTQEEINDWFDYTLDEAMIGPNGKLRSLWYTTDVRVLYYRKDLISEPPATWDELIDIASKISKQHRNVWGFVYPGGRGEGALMETFLPGFWSQGGELVDEAGHPTFNKGENHKYALKVLKFIKETIESGATPKRVAEFIGSAQMDSIVKAGQAAMMLGSNSLMAHFKDILEPKEFEKWEVAPIPVPAGAKRTSTAGGWNWGFFTDDPAKRAIAVDFILDVYAGYKGMPGWCKAGGYLPPRKSVYEYNHYFASDPLALKFKEYLKTTSARPGVPIYPTISKQLQIATSQVITGIKSPEEALESAWENVLAAYEK